MIFQVIGEPAALEPEEELILAVYRRARQDLVQAGRWGRDAELFFRLDGFDPAEIRRACQARRPLPRRSKLAHERRRLIREKREGGAPFKEIARELGITPERARQIYYAK